MRLPRLQWKPVLGGLMLLAGLAGWVRLGPLPAGLLDEPPASTLVLDRRGVPLYEARGADGTRTIKLTADTLPPILVAATVAAEDRRFWSHSGVDVLAIARALKANLAERAIVEGGSTISQQVAKLLMNRRDPNRHRGWRAKAYEAVVALRLEHRFEKRELLAIYLNLAAYGNQIAGAERASRAYFGVTTAMLTPAQAAFLAGLPQRPSAFNPYRNQTAALSRQRVVLRRMELAGALTAGQAGEAREERLVFAPRATAFVAPHFVEMLLREAAASRPSRIETTLDAALQAEIAGIIESHRPLLRRHGAAHVAVVVLENGSGEWLAWEGSGDYHGARGGTINGVVVPRQPGSALKPFTYALAFENGFTPATVLADIPASFPTAEAGILYTPRNYDGRFRGPLRARLALAGSQNVPAVSLASQLGVPRLLRLLGRAGLTTLDRNSAYYGLGLTLGNAEVRLDELVTAYAGLARGGEWIEPTYLKTGASRTARRIVSPRTAFWVTDILSDAEAREYAFGRGGSLEFPFPVAVKTGTSQAYHDNWTVGYSRHVTVGVWVGNFDRTPLRDSSGVTGAAPIFHAVMLAAERRALSSGHFDAVSSIMPVPLDTVRVEICALSGGAANAWCPNRRTEWSAAEGTLLLPCGWHHLTDDGLLTVLPPEYDAFRASSPVAQAFRLGAERSGGLAEALAEAGRPASTAALTIASPADGSTYLIDPTLRREFQALPLKALAAAGTIEWSINGRRIGKASAGEALDWPLTPGTHRFTVRDAQGRRADASITVR